MSRDKLNAVLIVLLTGIFAVSSGSFAAKGGNGNGGGKPPPPPPPSTQCEGEFPGFLYQVEATRKDPAELRIASTDACRTENVAFVPNLRQAAFHMTADRSAGVIVWTEDINNQYIVRRLDFTIDSSGDIEPGPGQPVTILPLVGEEPLPGDHRFYGSLDIWGDATNGSLYLAISRSYNINSGPDAGTGLHEAVIYDLNDLTGDLSASPDVRVFYELFSADGETESMSWLDAGAPEALPDCLVVPYPQFVPTCYRPGEFGFNPSGTRMYFERNLSKDLTSDTWHGVQRIHIDKTVGPDLADWVLTGPELVYTGTLSYETPTPHGMLTRPDSDVSVLPSPEYVAVLNQPGGSITTGVAILDADQCALDFAGYAYGNSEAPFDLSQGCLDNGTFFSGNAPGKSDTWQSPDALIRSSFKKRDYDLYRTYVSGPYWGTEELLIEIARFADSGQ